MDRGLRSLRPGMTLLLREGTHRLQNARLVRDLSGVTLRGDGPAQRVVVTCAPGVGLAFFNTSNLRIRNVTVSGCGLGRESWEEVIPTLLYTFELTFDVPLDLGVGVFVAASTDVSLENIVVEGTRGIGLLAVTPLGSTRLRNVHFQNNVPRRNCPVDLPSQLANQSDLIGGGAFILYEDFRTPPQPSSLEHSLRIERSRFTDNRDCSATVLVQNFIHRSVELAERGYQVGAGGGLTVMMAQSSFAVATSITGSEFDDNIARTGGGLHVGIFSGIPAVTSVLVRRCRFERNGRSDIVSSGGGMIVNVDLIRPAQLRGEVEVEDVEGGVLIDVQESTFERNMASSGGGVAIISHYSEQHVFDSTYRARFHDCLFETNQAFGGSAMLVYEGKISGFNPGLQLVISDSRFIRNSIQTNKDVEVGFVNDYGALHVRNVNVTLSGSNTFDRNLATALGSVSSLIHVSGTVVFERNKAVNGAGMQLLSDSLLILLSGARLTFRSNRADLFGGAIFVQMNPDNFTFVPDDCFLYFNQPGYGFCSDRSVCLPQNVSLSFMDNNARLGTIVYGSSLSTCPWIATLGPDFDPRQTVYSNLRRFQGTMEYSLPRGRAHPQFSTVTARLEVEKDLNISVMPGELFFVNITARDSFGQQVPEVMTSSVILGEDDDNTTSIIGDFGFFEVRPNRQSQAPVTVFGDGAREVTLRLTTIDLQSDTFLAVTLTSCSVGFTQTELRCVCDGRLASRGISCDANFTVGPDVWLGPVHDGANVTNDDLVVATCVLNYCGDGTREVRSGEWNLLCRKDFHRSGRLCGECDDGYSVKLGTNACARCSNWSLFLLLFFPLAGVFVVFGIGLLQISVAEGFFTAVVFYSNIITLYAVYFNDNEISGVNFLTAFFSLNFGIPACLYDGLDSLALVALQLTFVAYLFLLALVHILVGKRVTFKFVDHFNQKYSPSKAFATLIILSYVSILQSSFGILSFTVVSSFDGDRHVLWYIDPTVDYFSSFHAFLCIVAAVFLLLFLLPPPILFTFCTKAIYSWRYFNRFKPLYDALFAPFKARFRPWLGLQIIFRIILFVNTYFVPTPHNLLVVALCLIVYLHLQTTLQPYKLKWANRFESTLIVNALLYVTVTLYFGNFPSVSELARLLTVIFFSLMAAGVIIAGFLRHAVERNPKTWERVRNAIRKRRRKRENMANANGGIELSSPMQPPPKITFVDSVGNDAEEDVGTLQRAARSASVDYLNTLSEQDRARRAQEFEVSYTEFREPLLDEGEAEVVNSYSVVISQNSSAPGTPSRSRSPQKGLPKSPTSDLPLPLDNLPPRTTA